MCDQQAKVRPRVRLVVERGVRAGLQVRGRGRGAGRQPGGRRLEEAAGRTGIGQPGHTGRVRQDREEHAGPDRRHMRGEAEGEKSVPGRVQQDIAAVQQRESL